MSYSIVTQNPWCIPIGETASKKVSNTDISVSGHKSMSILASLDPNADSDDVCFKTDRHRTSGVPHGYTMASGIIDDEVWTQETQSSIKAISSEFQKNRVQPFYSDYSHFVPDYTPPVGYFPSGVSPVGVFGSRGSIVLCLSSLLK